MIGFVVLTLIYYAAIFAAWITALMGGMFLWRAGFRQSFGKNPGYVMLGVAVACGLVAAIANPSLYLGLVSTVGAIFSGFIGALIGIAIVAGIGYLLNPGRLEKYYRLIQHWLMAVQRSDARAGFSGEKPDETPSTSETRMVVHSARKLPSWRRSMSTATSGAQPARNRARGGVVYSIGNGTNKTPPVGRAQCVRHRTA